MKHTVCTFYTNFEMLDFIAGMSIKVCWMPKHTVVHSGQRIVGTEQKKHYTGRFMQRWLLFLKVDGVDVMGVASLIM